MHQNHVPQDTTSLVDERKEEKKEKQLLKVQVISSHYSVLYLPSALPESCRRLLLVPLLLFLSLILIVRKKSLVTRGVLTISQNIH